MKKTNDFLLKIQIRVTLDSLKRKDEAKIKNDIDTFCRLFKFINHKQKDGYIKDYNLENASNNNEIKVIDILILKYTDIFNFHDDSIVFKSFCSYNNLSITHNKSYQADSINSDNIYELDFFE